MCAVVTIYLKKKTINEHSVVCAFVSGTSYAYDYIYIYIYIYIYTYIYICVCVCVGVSLNMYVFFMGGGVE